MKQELTESGDCSVVCDESTEQDHLQLVGMTQIYSDKTAINLKANATVAYPVNVCLLNLSKEFRRKFIHHRYTFVELLPVPASGAEQDHILMIAMMIILEKGADQMYHCLTN